MKTTKNLIVMVAVSATVALHAQTSGNNAKGNSGGGSMGSNPNAPTISNGSTNKSKTADDDWLTLTALTTHAPSAVPGATKTAAQRADEHIAQVAQSRQAAQAAKDFYTQHPNGPRATQAQKLEAISALHGVQRGDDVQEQAAVATAHAYRSNPANSIKDRFDVALAMDQQDLSVKVAARTVKNKAVEEKKLVENWRAEFGDLPEIETYAASVAHRADPVTATAIATQVAQSPAAPTAAKAEAQSICARALLLGSALALKVAPVDGGEIDLARQSGKLTILVVWSPSEPASLQALPAIKQGLPRGAQIVYLAIGGTTGDVMRVRHTVPIPGHYAHAPAGVTANSAIAALKLRSAPYIYVLNRAGVLSDFGPLSEWPALLTRAGVTRMKNS